MKCRRLVADTPVILAISPPRLGFIELYNLEVEELHTFFVGTSGHGSALVHNGQGNYTKSPLRLILRQTLQPNKQEFGVGHSRVRAKHANWPGRSWMEIRSRSSWGTGAAKMASGNTGPSRVIYLITTSIWKN
jgi:hypothetical protein